jgi:hypothetical protein
VKNPILGKKKGKKTCKRKKKAKAKAKAKKNKTLLLQ